MNDSIYKEIILELYRNPLNKGTLSDYDVKEHDFSTSCGDDITIYIKFDENGLVKDVRHDGSGCAISQAAVSLLTDEVKGKTREELLGMSKDTMLELLSVPISYTRMSCALLGLKTLQKGIVKM